tara:strand:- start:725 stop:1240 length:516 start_codon:yes stop_codon:yes gene_type:complete
MKKKIIFFLISIFLIFSFVIFFKSLNKLNLYEPKSKIEDVPEFSITTFLEKKDVEKKDVFKKNKYYLLNIWASWCIPCRDEHSFLVNLSKNDKLEIIGLNYKDNVKNAKKFLKDLGNPYSKILSDKDGTQAIKWGAYGVPETFLVYENKIIKKYIGPLDSKSTNEIKDLIK